MSRESLGGREKTIAAAMRAIDIWVAILLLTGQLTTGGVFISSGAIWFSLAGPIFGNVRAEGKSPGANMVLDGIDVITAFLLIIGQITNTGPWITSGRFNPVVSGPAFGNTNVPVPIKSTKINREAQAFFNDFAEKIMKREINKR